MKPTTDYTVRFKTEATRNGNMKLIIHIPHQKTRRLLNRPGRSPLPPGIFINGFSTIICKSPADITDRIEDIKAYIKLAIITAHRT